jgi:hypothetical protein
MPSSRYGVDGLLTRRGVSAGERDGFKGRGYPDRGTPNDTKIGLVRAVRD